MDRRDFLKTLGLGGMALTLPKPLSIFAAKASDLSAPPIHAGLCRFRNLEKFPLHSFQFSLDDQVLLNQEQHVDLMNHWRVHMTIRRDERSYLPILEGVPLYNYCGYGVSGLSPAFCARQFLGGGSSINLMPTDTLDVWLTSDEKPKYALPPMTVFLYGPPKGYGITDHWVNGQPLPPRLAPLFPDCVWKSIRAVRLERTLAIEMGLALPSDPFEAL